MEAEETDQEIGEDLEAGPETGEDHTVEADQGAMTEETAEDMMTAEKIEEAGPEVMTEAEEDRHQDQILATN